MFHENTSSGGFRERMALWLPGGFSLALLILSVVSTPLFTTHAPVQIPDYIVYSLLGGLGALIHNILRRQQRRISALEAAALQNGRPSSPDVAV